MINKLKLFNIVGNQLNNILVERDHYFVENISLCNLGGYPMLNASFRAGSSGSITYTSELNTYFSPSFMFLVKHHKELHSAVSAFAQLIKELESVHENNGTCIEKDYMPYVNKSLSGSLNNFYHDLHTNEDIEVTYFENVDTYYDEKTSYHQPYLINILNFKKMENENDFKSLFNAAMFAKSLVGHFDTLMFALNGDNSFIQSELKRLSKEQANNFLVGYYVDNFYKKSQTLLELIKDEFEQHEKIYEQDFM